MGILPLLHSQSRCHTFHAPLLLWPTLQSPGRELAHVKPFFRLRAKLNSHPQLPGALPGLGPPLPHPSRASQPAPASSQVDFLGGGRSETIRLAPSSRLTASSSSHQNLDSDPKSGPSSHPHCHLCPSCPGHCSCRPFTDTCFCTMYSAYCPDPILVFPIAWHLLGNLTATARDVAWSHVGRHSQGGPIPLPRGADPKAASLSQQATGHGHRWALARSDVPSEGAATSTAVPSSGGLLRPCFAFMLELPPSNQEPRHLLSSQSQGREARFLCWKDSGPLGRAGVGQEGSLGVWGSFLLGSLHCHLDCT